MKLLVTGATGRVGAAVMASATGVRGLRAVGVSRAECDITKPAAITRVFGHEAPDVVIHAAALADVDEAERDPGRAFAVNDEGAGAIAWACAARSVPLFALSSDYVFDGRTARAYREDDPVSPLGVYGGSKAAGEAKVREAGGIVVRTAWVFGGDVPELVTDLVRRARTQAVIEVRAQRGRATYAPDLAAALLGLVARVGKRDQPLAPIYHACNVGELTRLELARAIVDELRRHEALPCAEVREVTRPPGGEAPRPEYSALATDRLDALGLGLPPWQQRIAEAVAMARVPVRL